MTLEETAKEITKLFYAEISEGSWKFTHNLPKIMSIIQAAQIVARAEQRMADWEILHKYAMKTVLPESLNLIEEAQKEILTQPENERIL